ncbi:MAG: hypothetical protein LBS99_04155, partial [Clostridiales bacterium]|nr:hypothetical protein [Clostridiales bacterium]
METGSDSSFAGFMSVLMLKERKYMTKIVLVVIVALCMEILDLVSTLLGSPLVYTLFTPWTLLKLRINPEAVFHESSLRAFAVLAFVLYIHFETVFGSLITKGDNTVVR